MSKFEVVDNPPPMPEAHRGPTIRTGLTSAIEHLTIGQATRIPINHNGRKHSTQSSVSGLIRYLKKKGRVVSGGQLTIRTVGQDVWVYCIAKEKEA